MKRLSFLAVAVAALMMFGTAHAELSWTLGVKGGLNIAKAAGEDADSLAQDSRTGMAAGVFVRGQVNEKFAFQVEGLYTMKGATDSESGVDLTAKFDYIEFPVLAVFCIPAGEQANVNIFAGPALAINTKAEFEGSGSGLSATIDVKDGTKTIDFGGVVGAGVDIAAGSMRVFVDGRWTYGFSTIDDGIAAVFDSMDTSTYDVKNSVFSFMIGLGWPLGE